MSDIPSARQIGVFGGTFDPVHVGHLLIAEFCRQELDLAEVRFIPAAKAPHKLHLYSSQSKHRWEMLKLAIGGNSSFVADDRELHRGGTSYTVDTLAELKESMPDAELVLLMGADSLAEFHTWRDPDQICRLARVVVVARGGHPLPNLELLRPYLPIPHLEEITVGPSSLARHQVLMPQIEISGSRIRQQVRAGRSIRYQVPASVEIYIMTHKLYQHEN